MSIQLCIVILYIVLLFAISFYVKRRASKNPTEYLFAGRRFSTGLVAVSITGMAVGAASTVGVAESATTIGLAAGWYNAAWAIGAVIMGFVAAGKYRALNCTTIPELFERSYDKKARVISVIGLSLIMICITSLQYVAGGSILHALMPDIFSMHAGMITSAVVFIGITAIGGLWSSGLSNILSVTVIYLGIIYSMVRILIRDGGISGINAALPQADFGWFTPMGGLSFAVLIGWIIVMTTQAITAQGPVQIACGAKDVNAARKGYILGGLLIFPVGFLCAVLGLAAKAQFPELNPTMALPQIIMSLDPFSSGMTLAALWAADVSTACTILLGAGTLVAQDIFKRFFKPDISQANYVKANRLIILIIGLGTLWLAFNAVGIVKVMRPRSLAAVPGSPRAAARHLLRMAHLHHHAPRRPRRRQDADYAAYRQGGICRRNEAGAARAPFGLGQNGELIAYASYKQSGLRAWLLFVSPKTGRILTGEKIYDIVNVRVSTYRQSG